MKRSVTRIILTGVLSVGIFVPQVLLAQGGLVPCGQGEACTLCHGFILFQNIYTFFLGLVASVGVLAFVAGGLIIMTARADPQQVQRGKSVLVNAVIGIIIALGSFLILNALVFILVPGDGFSPPGGAFSIASGQALTVEDCDTSDRFKDRGGGTGFRGNTVGREPSSDGGRYGEGIYTRKPMARRCPQAFAGNKDACANEHSYGAAEPVQFTPTLKRINLAITSRI